MKSTSVMAFVGLALLAILAVARGAQGRCPHSNNVITCCSDVRARRNGGLINYDCLRCDSGYKPSPSKNQCLPDVRNCREGYGPDMYNNGRCTKCSDDNCRDCSYTFYDCVECEDGYAYSNYDGSCVPLVLQS